MPRAGQASFSFSGGVPLVQFTDGVRGQVFRNGEVELPMSEVIHRGLADEGQHGWKLMLGRRDGVVLEFGNVAVEAWPIPTPLRVGRMNSSWDYRWLNVLMATAMFSLLVVLRFELYAMEGNVDGDDVSAPAIPVRVLRVATAQPQKYRRSNVELAPMRLIIQQRPAPKPAGVTRSDGGPRQVGPDIHKLFSELGGKGVLGNGGLSNELTRALSAVVSDSKALRGIGLRGNGGGGDLGSPLRLGGIGLNGGPPGRQPDPSLRKTESVSPPPPDIDSPEGTIDKELIHRIVREHLGQMRYCYEQLLPRMPNLSGRVTVKWHVTSQGIVDESEVVSSTAQTPELGSCVAGRVRTWRFPPAKQATAGFTVTYPFVFKLSGQ
jgi:TonB family protein